MDYEKEKKLALSFVKFARRYNRMSLKEKKKLNNTLRRLSRTTLGFLLENIPLEYTEFIDLVENIYIDTLATNHRQHKFLKESLSCKRENLVRQKNHVDIHEDTYNFGKHCSKFSKRKSSQHKAKEKAMAKVRKIEVGFY